MNWNVYFEKIWQLNLDLRCLLKYTADELLAKESCSSLFKKNNSANNESDKGRYTTSSFALGSHEVTHNIIENVCWSELHSPPQCKKASNVGSRIEIFKKDSNVFCVWKKVTYQSIVYQNTNVENVKGRIHCEFFFSEHFMKYSFRVILWNMKYCHEILLL